MKGDFTRVSFDPARHFSRVLLQQGRVTLDADPNEQTDILLHYLRSLARDLIGPYAGPEGAFALGADAQGMLTISPGHYYVDGLLCENEVSCPYAEQPDYEPAAEDPLLQALKQPGTQVFWIYLDVWERHLSAIEDERIREVALNGPDTCARSKVIWQVKALPAEDQEPDPDTGKRDCAAPLAGLSALSAATLAARVDPGQRIEDPCITDPESRYRGAENHLYRVEIHRGGKVGTAEAPSFKWSRDNGSVATRWLGTEGQALIVASTRGFTPGCWLELSDEVQDLRGAPGVLVRLVKVEGDRLHVDLGAVPAEALNWSAQRRNPKLRRWDQSDRGDITLDQGAVPVAEAAAGTPAWIDLEDGLQIQFSAGGVYRSGDYWLIPARVASGTIEWPAQMEEGGDIVPEAMPARGVAHHYAPLGFLSWNDGVLSIQDCHCHLLPINSCRRAARVVPAPVDRSPAPTERTRRGTAARPRNPTR